MLSRKTPSYPSSAQKREREDWANQFDRCWVCGWGEAWGVPLETHEIGSRAQAPLRWADKRNYFCACHSCNGDILNYLCEPLQLAYKKMYDPDNYDRQFINEIRGHAPDAIAEHEVVLWTKYLKVGR